MHVRITTVQCLYVSRRAAGHRSDIACVSLFACSKLADGVSKMARRWKAQSQWYRWGFLKLENVAYDFVSTYLTGFAGGSNQQGKRPEDVWACWTHVPRFDHQLRNGPAHREVSLRDFCFIFYVKFLQIVLTAAHSSTDVTKFTSTTMTIKWDKMTLTSIWGCNRLGSIFLCVTRLIGWRMLPSKRTPFWRELMRRDEFCSREPLFKMTSRWVSSCLRVYHSFQVEIIWSVVVVVKKVKALLHLKEFFALMDFANPGMLGSAKQFKRVFETAIVEGRDANADQEQKELADERLSELQR